MAYHLTIYARSGGLIEGFPGYVYCYFLNGGLACVDCVLEGYNPDVLPISDAEMFGFIRNNGGTIQVSNQIFETRLYNFFLSQEELKSPIYQIGVDEKKRAGWT